MSTVGQLYDDLFTFERKSKGADSQPIHKALRFEEKGIENLYQWILSNEDFSGVRKILDCGCGAGYGSVLLAKSTAANVDGISISEKEVEQAIAFAKSKGVTEKCNFQLCSFDDVSDQYDCIIAIESLKHSPDLKKTMKVLSNQLRTGGKLIVFEDFYQGDKVSFSGTRLMNDWILKELHTESDYQAFGLQVHTEKEFTKAMKTPGALVTMIKLGVSELIVGLGKLGLWNYASAKIFRGAFYLDWLYLKNDMQYKMLQLVKQ